MLLDDHKAVVGIDASLGGTAIVVWQHDHFSSERFESEPATGVHERIDRFIKLVYRVICKIPNESHVFIEGYSHGSKSGATSDIHEYGGLLRWNLIDIGCRIIEVAPTSLKKFACESAGSKKNKVSKELIQAHIARRWGLIFNSNDEADAYVLARIGMVKLGRLAPENVAQRDVAERVGQMPVKKKRKGVA